MTRICQYCEKPYDSSNFGASRYYCSPKCKHTFGGKLSIKEATRDDRPGPKRLFPIQDLAECQRIVDRIKDWGFTITPSERSPNLLRIQRGFWPIDVCFGSNGKLWPYAQVALYWGGVRNEALSIMSTCRDGRHASTNDFITQPHRKRTWRQPCGMCRKCLATKFLRRVEADWQTENNAGLRAMNNVPLEVKRRRGELALKASQEQAGLRPSEAPSE